ncbi:[LysW]-aminoadipate semialdehyde/glutamate semialdehyde transaminase [uncultured archaeon]|nr:[LysW]-aminoadipate semialdehyde/glutamate semialdehyde transaminase [uncultured archaeon]
MIEYFLTLIILAMKMKIIDAPGKNSRYLHEKSKLIGRTQNACLYGIALQSGDGNHITDVDGNRYLDFLSGAASNTIGYGRRDVVEAYAKTAMRLQHSCYMYTLNKEAIELAEKLIDITPGDFEKKVLFDLSGSSSIDGAIKVARKFTGKKGIITFKNSEHGSTSLSIQASTLSNLTGLFLDDGFYHVTFPTKEEEIVDILAKIKSLFRQGIAAILIEPIQGDAGVIVPPKNFFKDLYYLSKENGVLFIVDEIQTCAGRTGRWWGIENFDVVPDIVICGKGISGGYAPISAVIGEEKMIDSLEKAQHLFTYGGHPPSCAATKKVLDIIEKEKLMENALQIGKLLESELKQLKNCNVVKDFRGIGLMLGLDVASENLAGIAGMRCIEYGLYPGYYGKYNEVLRLQPPLTLTEVEALWAARIIKKVIDEMENKEIPNSTIEKYKKYSRGGICSTCSINSGFEETLVKHNAI